MDVRAARLAAGMSQSQLALAAGVPQPNLSAYENNRRTPSLKVLERIGRALKVRPSTRLREHRDAVLAAVAAHHAVDPQIFGSVARGEDRPGSDLDLVVRFTEEASILDEVGLRIELSDLLGIPVDVVGADALRGDFGARVIGELVPL